MTLILDAGAFIAVERGDRELAALIAGERRRGRPPITHGGVVGQVWRDGARQALIAKLLGGLEVRGLDEELGRRAGMLLGRASATDVIDAALILLAEPGDRILTSDPSDVMELTAFITLDVEIVTV